MIHGSVLKNRLYAEKLVIYREVHGENDVRAFQNDLQILGTLAKGYEMPLNPEIF